MYRYVKSSLIWISGPVFISTLLFLSASFAQVSIGSGWNVTLFCRFISRCRVSRFWLSKVLELHGPNGIVIIPGLPPENAKETTAAEDGILEICGNVPVRPSPLGLVGFKFSLIWTWPSESVRIRCCNSVFQRKRSKSPQPSSLTSWSALKKSFTFSYTFAVPFKTFTRWFLDVEVTSPLAFIAFVRNEFPVCSISPPPPFCFGGSVGFQHTGFCSLHWTTQISSH